MHIAKKVILGENYKNTIDALFIHTQRSNVVETNVELVSFFFNTNRIWVFDGIFVFDTIWVYIPCMNLHTWSKSS